MRNEKTIRMPAERLRQGNQFKSNVRLLKKENASPKKKKKKKKKNSIVSSKKTIA